jgi:hypothetical protein
MSQLSQNTSLIEQAEFLLGDLASHDELPLAEQVLVNESGEAITGRRAGQSLPALIVDIIDAVKLPVIGSATHDDRQVVLYGLTDKLAFEVEIEPGVGCEFRSLRLLARAIEDDEWLDVTDDAGPWNAAARAKLISLAADATSPRHGDDEHRVAVARLRESF